MASCKEIKCFIFSKQLVIVNIRWEISKQERADPPMNRPALEMPGLMSSTVSRYFNIVLLSDEYSSEVLEENRRSLFKTILFHS